MSFGYSIGDGILLVQLAWKTVQGAIQACGEHDELTREVSSLHRVLQRLHRELSNPNSLLNQADKERREELEELGDGCKRILNVMNSIVTKYNMLSNNDRKGKRIWQKVKFGNGEMKDLAEIRLKLSAHTSALIMSLNLCSLGSQSRVEKQLNGVGGDLEGIRTKVEWIAANMTAKNGDSTVWTSYTNDDKSFWRELRRELVREGYQSSVIHKHKHLLKEYVEELGSRGVFDHISDEEHLENDTEEASLKSTYPREFSSGDAEAEDTKPEMSDSEDSEKDEASSPRWETETDSEAPSDAVGPVLSPREAAFERGARRPWPIRLGDVVDEEFLPRPYPSAGAPQAAEEVSEWHKADKNSLLKNTSSQNKEPMRRLFAIPTSGLRLPEIGIM
jgi:hypothetical protein